MTGIDDLFYDNETNPASELRRLQAVIDSERYQAYLSALFHRGTNNRSKFRAFAEEMLGLDDESADEVFSCATDSFGRDSSGTLHDVAMNKHQFVVGIVRLANLFAIMNDGMAEASRLGAQTAAFLDHAISS
jgi:hypothetical protein